MMSSHTFVNEPSGQHLEQALKYIYHHHNKQDLYNRLDSIPLTNTWDNVVDTYEGVLMKSTSEKEQLDLELDKFFADLEAQLDEIEVADSSICP